MYASYWFFAAICHFVALIGAEWVSPWLPQLGKTAFSESLIRYLIRGTGGACQAYKRNRIYDSRVRAMGRTGAVECWRSDLVAGNPGEIHIIDLIGVEKLFSVREPHLLAHKNVEQVRIDMAIQL